ncbi:MAG: UvrD-helicase domain-containing protein [Clostridia bacterium]|nr:UvrD-helicase domain-containing protein [Clostridia bacterium]
MSIVNNLNEEQRLPVLQTEGAVLVTAGAGSGKTRLLTHRIAYLIQEQGVAPYNILAITFTNKAAREMKERVERMVPCGSQIWVSTFHSLCVTILRRFIDKFAGYNKNFTIYSDIEKGRVLKDIYKDLCIDDEDTRKSIEYHLANIKNTNSNAEVYVQNLAPYINKDEILQVCNKYQQTLKANNALDFDDLLVFTYKLLKDYADVREYYQDKFRYIHVDEFQDTNTIQYDIVCLLAGKWGNILVVGDEDQCIYGWRGANIQNIMDFKRDFPNAKVFKLQQNYRSTKRILDVANKVIDNNSQRLKKTLWTENEEGTDVRYFVAGSDRDEAEFVTRTIYNLVSKEGYKYSDFAVLMRLTSPSRVVEQAMLNYNIPYKMLGGFRFFERTEIKNVIGYLRAIVNPRDNDSILRIINYPKRGIGDTSIEQIKKFANGGSLLNVILNYNQLGLTPALAKKLASFAELYLDLREKSETMGLTEFAEYVIKQAQIEESFDQTDDEDYNRLQNVREFVSAVKEFEENNAGATLQEYLESITLVSDIDSVGEDDDYCLLSTIHAVKGLEFRCVFVIALEEGLFPINKGGERPSDIEEERRLAYVAVTRAEERLFLTRSRQRFMYKEFKYQDASRFLKEMGFEEERNRRITANANFDNLAPSKKPDTTKSIQNLLNSRLNEQKKDFSGFTKGVQVMHPKFGVGEITDDSCLQKNKTVTINFGGMGSKTLSLEYAPLQILKRKGE